MLSLGAGALRRERPHSLLRRAPSSPSSALPSSSPATPSGAPPSSCLPPSSSSPPFPSGPSGWPASAFMRSPAACTASPVLLSVACATCSRGHGVSEWPGAGRGANTSRRAGALTGLAGKAAAHRAMAHSPPSHSPPSPPPTPLLPTARHLPSYLLPFLRGRLQQRLAGLHSCAAPLHGSSAVLRARKEAVETACSAAAHWENSRGT